MDMIEAFKKVAYSTIEGNPIYCRARWWGLDAHVPSKKAVGYNVEEGHWEWYPQESMMLPGFLPSLNDVTGSWEITELEEEAKPQVRLPRGGIR